MTDQELANAMKYDIMWIALPCYLVCLIEPKMALYAIAIQAVLTILNATVERLG